MPPMKLEVVLAADTAKFIAGMGDSERKTTALGKTVNWLGNQLSSTVGKIGATAKALFSLRSAAVVAVAGLAASLSIGQLNQASEEVDKLGKASKRLGIPVKELSAMRLAALDANIEFEQLAAFAGKAQKNIATLVDGGLNSLKLGDRVVQLTDVTGKIRSMTELLPEIARGIDSASSSAEKIRLSDKIFGRGGGEAFLQLLTDGGDYIKNLGEQTERARKLGVLFTDDQVARLTAYNDSITHLQQAWLGLRVRIVNAFAPDATALIEASAARLAGVLDLVNSIKEATKDVMKGGAEGAAASRAIGDVRDKGVNAMRVTAIEVGKLIGTAFVEAITIGIEAAGPHIADILRDYVLPVFEGIPGVKIDRSQRGKLAMMRKQADEKPQLEARVRELENVLDNSTTLDGADRRGVEFELDAARGRLARMAEEFALFDKAVERQEGIVERQAEGRARDLATAMVTGFGRTAEAAAEAKSKIKDAWNEFDASADHLRGTYNTVANETAATTQNVTAEVREQINQATKYFETYEDQIRAALDLSQDLDERALSAGGNEVGAKRMQMLRNFTKEQEDLVERFGDLSSQLMDRLKEVQAFELQAFDLEPLDKMLEKIKGMVPDSGSGPVADMAVQMQMLRAGFIDGKVSSEELRAELERLERRLRGIQEREKTYGQLLSETIQGFARSASDAFADMVVDGETSFNQLLKSWTKTLISMTAQKFLFQPLFDAFAGGAAGLFKPGVSPSSGYYAQNGIVGSQRYGSAFGGGAVVPFAKGGVVYKPALFPMAKGMGLMGEAGPEAIMPLTRIGGHLGVRSAGGGTTVQIIDQRSGGAPVEVRESAGPDGRKMVQAIVRDQVAKMATDGSLDRVLGPAYGARRTPVAR